MGRYGRFAEGTHVAPEKSQAEIRGMLMRFGAVNYAYFEGAKACQVAFEFKERRVLFRLPMPTAKDVEVSRRSRRGVDEAVAQEVRRRWRALCLVIKAKLESVAGQIETFDQAFLAHVVLPTGETIGDAVSPKLNELYKGIKIPLLQAGPITAEEVEP